jgi:hypothetical protein
MNIWEREQRSTELLEIACDFLLCVTLFSSLESWTLQQSMSCAEYWKGRLNSLCVIL